MVFNYDESPKSKYIEVAEQVQRLTIDLWDTNENTPIKNQSLGADLISSLSSKLIKSIFPFGQIFFRLFSENIPPEIKQNVDDMLIELEDKILKETGQTNIRSQITSMVENLLISGNALLDCTGDKLLFYKLNEYIVERRENGEWYRVVIKKEITVLPTDETIYTKYIPTSNVNQILGTQSEHSYEYHIEILKIADNNYTISEYINHEEVVEQRQEHLKEVAIYPVWLYENLGQSYSYGYARRYLGGLNEYDILSKISVSSAIIGSKVVNLVNPSSLLANNLDELNNARNGDYIVGQEGDIVPFTSGNAYNLDWVLAHMEPIKKELSIAFLHGVGAVRNSERTTAFEVQMLISEMSEKFGGFYITMSQSLQSPIFEFLLNRLKISNKIGHKKDIEVEFLTGISELRNGEALNKLAQLVPLEAIYQSGLPNQILSYEKVLSLYAKHLGVPYKDIQKDEAEIQAEEQTNANRMQMEAKMKQQEKQNVQ